MLTHLIIESFHTIDSGVSQVIILFSFDMKYWPTY